MKALPGAVCVLLAFSPMRNPMAGSTPAGIPRFSRPQSNYLLGCGGCHGENGTSNSKLVPELRGQVGFFLNTPEGREYLVRLPNVAFSVMSDQELADVLNFMVFQIGGDSVPPHTEPYTSAEVGKLRRQPLNEVSLVRYRNQLIETLIGQHNASERLRIYAGDRY